MKRFIYLFNLTLIGSINVTIAQVVTICGGNDTIVLRTGNYHYGTIEWEQSIDNIKWTKINGASDTVYQFLPTETRYYRAVNKFSDCPPEYSQVSKVQMPPVANAGGDRTIPDTSVVLMGLLEEGATGAWSVFSGTGGSFSNTGSPSAVFQGSDSLYTLVWTVTNDCGTSSDTVNIQFRNNTYIETLVVVDTTDVLLSDSAQMAAGQYIIVFSTPVPSIGDSTILIGLTGDGFLRKVTSFTANGDTLNIQAEQATLEDITIDGAYDLAQILSIDSIVGAGKSQSKVLDHMPTRAELKSDHQYKNGIFYYFPKSKPDFFLPGVSQKKHIAKNAGTSIDLQFDQTIINENNIELTLNGGFHFEPNIQADLDYSWLTLHSFRVGMYNAVIEQNVGVEFSATATASIFDHEFTLAEINKDIVIITGGVPVWVRTQVSFEGKASVELSAGINVSHEITKSSLITAALEYNNGDWTYPYSKNDEVNVDNSISVTGNATQTFEIGPSLNFKIFGIVGPYLEARLKEDLSLCSYNANWQASANIGASITVGAKAQIITENPLFTLNFILFDKSKTWSQEFYHLQFPDNMEIISGNNQSYVQGITLMQPIKVKVSSNKGFALPGAIVHFSPQNGGSVGNSIVTTNSEGYAQTTWTPVGSGQSQLEISVLDCDGNNIENSPLIFIAYETETCSQSSLSASVHVNGTNINPVGHLGNLPYTYSQNGNSYSSTIPVVSVTPGNTYTFYVKDEQGCIAVCSYTASTYTCNNTTLALSISVNGNTILANATGGLPPYQYRLDSPNGAFLTLNSFVNVPTGNHTIYVKDSNGCIKSSNTNVTSVTNFTCGVSTLSDYDGNVYNTVQIGSQCWMKQNLATTHFSDGTGLNDGANSPVDECGPIEPYWFVYNNEISYKSTYGLLYNWNAAMKGEQSTNSNPSGVQGICPVGWHLPSKSEWISLTNYLGGQNICGGSLKETGTDHWLTPNIGATNESGFTALPGGIRFSVTDFNFLGSMGNWWSSTQCAYTWVVSIGNESTYVGISVFQERIGISVRCIKDNISILPNVSTKPITGISQFGATGGGNVISDGGAPITSRGVCWNTSGSPTISDNFISEGSGLGLFSCIIGNLAANTLYFYRAFASNNIGTSYGNEIQFITGSQEIICSLSTITDFDGNIYNTVQIGNQCWMKENLATTHYSDGTSLIDGTNAFIDTEDTVTKYWFVYNNNLSNKSIYGLLYTWAAIMNGAETSNINPGNVQGICPPGWHVPSLKDWENLNCFLGGGYIAGGKLKESGTMHWLNPNIGATNETGFTALPGGLRGFGSQFCCLGYDGVWWTSTADSENNTVHAVSKVMEHYHGSVYGSNSVKTYGHSMRCIKD
jgi:uncharacterized protein (TIGR02145 family)